VKFDPENNLKHTIWMVLAFIAYPFFWILIMAIREWLR